MKNILKGYIELTDKQKEVIWDNCIFVFDTNILLNLYRYPNKISRLLLTSMRDLQDKIWLPYNVVEEFIKNRQNIIISKNNDINRMDKVSGDYIEEWCKLLKLNIDDTEIKDISLNISNWIEKIKKEYIIDSSNDTILEELVRLFDEKVGVQYSEEELIDIKKIAEQRYKKEIPPGFKDTNKKKNENDNNMYGDYIIWRQILDYSKVNSCNIIFITQDNKEDWWNRVSGKTLGPRYELRKEFNDVSNMEFHMYSMEKFLKIHKNIGENVISEIKRMELEEKYNIQVGHMDLSDGYTVWQVEEGLKELMEKKEQLFQYDIMQLDEKGYDEMRNLRDEIKKSQEFLEYWGIWFN